LGEQYVESVASSTQTDEAMGGVCYLGALATAAQRRYRIRVNQLIVPPLAFWATGIAESGERKTVVMTAVRTVRGTGLKRVRMAKTTRQSR
jgi:hypothetical protein